MLFSSISKCTFDNFLRESCTVLPYLKTFLKIFFFLPIPLSDQSVLMSSIIDFLSFSSPHRNTSFKFLLDYDKVKIILKELKKFNGSPNVLCWSNLLSSYCQWKSGDKFLFADLSCSLLLLLFNGMIVKFESKPYWTLKIFPAVIHHCHKVGIWFIS